MKKTILALTLLAFTMGLSQEKTKKSCCTDKNKKECTSKDKKAMHNKKECKTGDKKSCCSTKKTA